MAKIIRVELNRKQPNSTYDPKTGKYVTYKINVRVGGRRYRQSGFATRKAAETYIDGLLLRRTFTRAGIKTAGGQVRLEAFLNRRCEQITNRAEQVRAERIFPYFVDLTGSIWLHELRSSHIQIFINARLNDGVKAETVNREINLLSGALSRASQLFPEELEDYEMPKIPRPKFKRKRREKVIDDHQKDAILAQLAKRPAGMTDADYANRQRIARMFHIAYLLGMAYSEVANAKKTDYNGEGFEFDRKKTGQHIVFEWLPEEAHEVLRAAIASSETEYIFTISGSTPKNFYPIMQKAVEDAGMVYGRDNGITFHSARHSFVTVAMQHTDLKTVGSMSGHSDATMVLRYTHASAETRKKALQSMYGKRDLKAIFERVRSGKMDLAEFEKLLS